MICFVFVVGNFGVMVMENMGDVVGMVSLIQGLFLAVIGVIGGMFIGVSFNGMIVLLYICVIILGLVLIVVIWIVEGGLFVVCYDVKSI